MTMTQRGSLVDRAIARIWLFVRDNKVDEKKLDRALRTVPGAVEERAAVVDRLREFGVAVVASKSEPQRAADIVVAPPSKPRTAETQSAVTGGEDEEANPDASATDAARVVLQYDQRYGPRPNRLLSAVEEVGLITMLRDGHNLTEQLPSGYRRALKEGSDAARAFDSMVIHNIRLVYKIAGAHVSRVSSSGTVLDLDDLAQAGMVGLIRAIEMFDASRGLKFSTYATNWIRQSIGREIDNSSRLIRLPVHLMDEIRSIWAAVDKLRSSGRRVDSEAIGEICALDPAKVARYLDYLRTPASLDLTVGDEDSTAMYAFVPAALEAGPEYAAMAWSDANDLNEVLSALEPRSAQILRLRAGLDGDEPMTLDEIGAVFGVSRERIRQLEAKALKQLRDSPFASELRRMIGRVHVIAAESGFNPGPRCVPLSDRGSNSHTREL